jgi:hypothetical protein
MAFTIKHTRSDRPMVAEYTCPVHGRFALEVQRDANGDPPASWPCQLIVGGATWPGREGIRSIPTPCGSDSPHTISAQRVTRVRRVEVARGSYQKPELPTWTDTTNLGEGQDLDDWIADRDKVWEAERQKEIKEMLT